MYFGVGLVWIIDLGAASRPVELRVKISLGRSCWGAQFLVEECERGGWY